MNAPVRFRPGAVWSLWDMLEVNGQAFMDAVIEMRRVRAIIDHALKDEDRKQVVEKHLRDSLIAEVEKLGVAVNALYGQLTNISVQRILAWFKGYDALTWEEVSSSLEDIESRLRDELSLVRLFVLDQRSSVYLLPGHALLGQRVADRFPSLVFEMEEAAKCTALSRPTASAFHCMRALEVAIRALAKFLRIDDPVKPAEKNWGFVLGEIKTKMDEDYPARARMPGMVGAELERVEICLNRWIPKSAGV